MESTKPTDRISYSFTQKQYNTSSYTQNPRLVSNDFLIEIVNNFSVLYPKLKKWTSGVVLLGTSEGDELMHMNKYVVYMSLCESAILIDMLLDQTFYPITNSTMSVYSCGPLLKVPNEIINPPEMDVKHVRYNDTLGTYTPIEKKFTYLENFRVSWNGTRMPTFTYKDLQDNIVAQGNVKRFGSQLKGRSFSPQMSFVIALLSYRCDHCVLDLDVNCHCYLNSPSLHMLVQTTKRGMGIPFRLNIKDNHIVKHDPYPYISSIIPTLWFALMEISLRRGLGTIDGACERTITYIWTNACRDVLFGNALDKMKKLVELEKHILGVTKLIAVTVSKENRFLNTSDASMFYTYNQKDYDKFLDDNDLRGYLNDRLVALDNKTGRRAFATVNQLYVLPMTIHTPITLSLIQSTRAISERPPLAFKEIEWVYLGDEWVPIAFEYDDPDLQWMENYLLQSLDSNPPDLSQLEYAFIEAATTNSAGIDRAALDEIKASIIKELGDTPEVKEYVQYLNMRIFDVIRVIKDVYCSPDSFLMEWIKDRMTAVRYQVGRRGRTIQMLRTVFMAPAFLIKTLMDAIGDTSDFIVTGKTTNDVRDMHSQMYSTGRCMPVNSMDIVGMDTNTSQSVQRFPGAPLVKWLRNKRSLNYNFYLNKINGKSQMVGVKHRKLVNGVHIESSEYVSVLEFFAFMDMKAISGKSIIVDAVYGTKPCASNHVLNSGTYKTTDQNNMINNACTRRAEDIISRKYDYLLASITANIQGDDHTSSVNTPYVTDKILEISKEAAEECKRLFGIFGFGVDTQLEIGIAEFLKLRCIMGMPSMLISRLSLFTSERGEEMSKSGIARLTNALGILREMIARVSNHDHIPVIMRYCAMALSYSRMYVDDDYKSQVGRYIHATDKDNHKERLRNAMHSTASIKLDSVFTDNTNSDVLIYDRDVFDKQKVALYIFPAVWYTITSIGVPPYGYVNGSLCEPAASFMSFPSPATVRRMFNTCRYNDDVIDKLRSDSYNLLETSGFDAWRASLPVVLRREVDLRVRGMQGDIKRYTAMLRTHRDLVPISPVSRFNKELAIKYGFLQGYKIVRDMLSTVLDFEPGPVLASAMKVGDSFLNPAKALRSHMASYTLRDKYNITIPELQRYDKRVSARMTSAAKKRDEKVELDLAYMTLFSNINDVEFPDRLVDDLVFGDYNLVVSNITDTDYGYVDIYNHTGFGSSAEAGSLMALYIDIFGLPKMSASSGEAVKESITKELLIPGAADDVLKLLARVYRRGGKQGLSLAFEAVGLPEKSKVKIVKLFEERGTETTAFPYSLNPRQFFLVDTNPSNIPARLFRPSKGTLQQNTQRAFYFAEVAMNPWLLKYSCKLQAGPSMVSVR
jgi:hypothetical protein